MALSNWVWLARKGRCCLLCFVIGGCGTWICPCWRSIHSPFHTSINTDTLFFCYLVSCPYAGSLGSVRCVCVCFGFYLSGLDLKPLVVGINCIIFSCYKKVNWVRLMSPQFVVLSFFLFNIFRIGLKVSSALLLLKKKTFIMTDSLEKKLSSF
jgi:hypothetical protein